jgi:hypothetical protein
MQSEWKIAVLMHEWTWIFDNRLNVPAKLPLFKHGNGIRDHAVPCQTFHKIHKILYCINCIMSLEFKHARKLKSPNNFTQRKVTAFVYESLIETRSN